MIEYVGTPRDLTVPVSDDPLMPLKLRQGSPLYLAMFPVKNTWEITKHLPLSYGDVYTPQVVASFLKYAFDQWGAVPVLAGGDFLTMIASRRLSQEERFDLACQQWAFDMAILADHETIWSLANALTKTNVWTFWFN